VDVRIIAATNQGLERLVEQKRFREDLFYRLNVIAVELPPLKERREDIPLLIDHILKQLNVVKETRVNRISEDAMEVLLNYDYPGNVRELENILEHAAIICQDDIIEHKHLPLSLQKRSSPGEVAELPAADSDILLRGEKQRIIDILDRNNWHRGKAARELHMDRTTLWRKIKRYNLSP
jgi:transcriptional regulator with PAS, ATPase and Fis domain